MTDPASLAVTMGSSMTLARLDEPARRFCVVTETYPPEINGVAHTLSRLVGGLRARGHEVSVVRPRQHPADASAPADADGAETALVRGLPLPGYGSLRFGLPAGRILQERWRRRRPDAIYVATEGPLGCSAVGTARRLDIPAYSGFHTNFHAYARHYHARALSWVALRGLRWFHNRTRGTLVASPDLRDQLAAAGFRDVHVLGRGVDARRFAPAHRSAELRARWGAGDGTLVALHVGRLAPEKNVRLAVHAFRAMRGACPTARLVIV